MKDPFSYWNQHPEVREAINKGWKWDRKTRRWSKDGIPVPSAREALRREHLLSRGYLFQAREALLRVRLAGRRSGKNHSTRTHATHQ